MQKFVKNSRSLTSQFSVSNLELGFELTYRKKTEMKEVETGICRKMLGSWKIEPQCQEDGKILNFGNFDFYVEPSC